MKLMNWLNKLEWIIRKWNNKKDIRNRIGKDRKKRYWNILD